MIGDYVSIFQVGPHKVGMAMGAGCRQLPESGSIYVRAHEIMTAHRNTSIERLLVRIICRPSD